MGLKANVKSIAAAKVGRHQIEGVTGLYLHVGETSARWLFRYHRPDGRPTETGLGSTKDVSLQKAVKVARDLREQVLSKVDPVAFKRQQRQRQVTDDKTLRDALAQYGEEFADRAGAREGVRLIQRHAAALLTRPMNEEMTAVEVKTVLVKVQASHPKTAARTRTALSALFSFCVGHGWRHGNPCDREVWRNIAPPAPKSVPYRMMPLKMLPDFYRRLLERDSVPSLALAFTIATAARQAETTGMTHDDLDLEARLWVVPPHKIKMRREHRQPLSDAALNVLARIAALNVKSSYVFPGQGGSRMGPRSMENVMHRQEYQPYSVHATARATFSTWAHTKPDHPHELIELALAHEEGRGNAVARAYNRSDALERRRQLMADWGAFLTTAAAP